MEFSIPGGLLMGVSTASMQVEGGQVNANWNDWYTRGHIKDGTDPASGNDHWERWQEDTELMAAMGLQLYRFSIEWARLMPEEGRVDEAAVDRYRQELLLLKEKNIRPLMTLHHFSNPMWFEEKGAFEKLENLRYYLELVELAVDRFGDLVSDYITINEPNVYATNSYFFGQWPPGKTSLGATLSVMENLAYCHIKAYMLIHEKRRAMGYTDTMVGCANHLRVFAPKTPSNLWHRLCAGLTGWLFQDALTEAMTLGRFPLPLRNRRKLPKGEYTDFIGLNYYTRSTVSGIGDGVRENSPRNDLDWEIYPQGVTECAQRLYRVLPRPIWVTENGTCDNDDRFRCRYLYEHLKALSLSALPFQRYYHWCFCDNFEWVEGNSAKFGLVSVDPVTRQRRIKKSGHFYSSVIREKGVSQALYKEFVAEQEYDIGFSNTKTAFSDSTAGRFPACCGWIPGGFWSCCTLACRCGQRMPRPFSVAPGWAGVPPSFWTRGIPAAAPMRCPLSGAAPAGGITGRVLWSWRGSPRTSGSTAMKLPGAPSP